MKKKITARLLAAALAAAVLFTGMPADAYAETLVNTSEEEGEVLLTTDSPLTDLAYTHEDKFEGYELFNGIDVSKWQNLQFADEQIDWAACKEAGIDFAFVRVGYRSKETGEITEDPYYRQNIEGALANDISVGVYFFSLALTAKEAKEEAKFVLKCIQDYDITFPIVIDYEGGGRVDEAYADGTLTKESATKAVRAFCKYIENAGYTPMLYANNYYLMTLLNGEELAGEYKIWLARWRQEVDYVGTYEFWQYSDSGYIGSMQVDSNFFYKNFNIETSEPAAADRTQGSITLEWEPTGDALGYQLYRLDPDTGKYKKIATTTECSYTDENLSAGTEYTYKIRAYWTIGGTTYTAKFSTAASACTFVKQVNNLTATARGEDSITLGWKAVSRANGYKIYQYDAGSDEYIEIADVSGKSNTTYQVTGLTGSKAYKFVVCAYRKYNGEKMIGEASEELTARTNPVKIQSLTASAATAKAVTLQFTTQKRVTGYIVYRYNSATGKWKKLGTSTDGTFKDKTVAANTSYKYRVRAYKESAGVTYYGKYSKTLTVKTKKKKS